MTTIPTALSGLSRPTVTLPPTAPPELVQSLERSRLLNDVFSLVSREAQLNMSAYNAEYSRHARQLHIAIASGEPSAISAVPPLDTTPTPPAAQLIEHANNVYQALQRFAASNPALASQVQPFLDAFAKQLAPEGQQAVSTDPSAADRLWALAHSATQYLLLQARAA